MMKKIIFLLITSITFIFLSCEKDDFCTEQNSTPSLIIDFKDYENQSKEKTTTSLNIWVSNKDSLITKAKVKKIELPLNPNTKTTKYFFSNENNNITEIVFNYTTNDKYISRSCGFITEYNDIKITVDTSNSWVKKISKEEIKNINDQTNAHITIYH